MYQKLDFFFTNFKRNGHTSWGTYLHWTKKHHPSASRLEEKWNLNFKFVEPTKKFRHNWSKITAKRARSIYNDRKKLFVHQLGGLPESGSNLDRSSALQFDLHNFKVWNPGERKTSKLFMRTGWVFYSQNFSPLKQAILWIN